MELEELCQRIALARNIELTPDMQFAISRWAELFDRPVYSFTDFVDAIALWDPALGDIDLDEARAVWFEMHEMDTQQFNEVLLEESACGRYQLWGVA